MKKYILSLAMAGVILSPLTTFAAEPGVPSTRTQASGQTQVTLTSQEKNLAKKLGQIKYKSKDTKQKIKINITQSKAKINKAKKERSKTKKSRVAVIKKTKTTTATTTVR